MKTKKLLKKKKLTDKEKAFQEMLKKMQSEFDGNFVVKQKTQKKKLSLKETIDKKYLNPEIFYYDLFNKIKTLAENKIAYGDTHVGNIMPNFENEKGLQLIDFDGAEILNEKDEKLNSINSSYNSLLFAQFQELPNLSKKSEELIKWFQK